VRKSSDLRCASPWIGNVFSCRSARRGSKVSNALGGNQPVLQAKNETEDTPSSFLALQKWRRGRGMRIVPRPVPDCGLFPSPIANMYSRDLSNFAIIPTSVVFIDIKMGQARAAGIG
jgi:hypothetical protein